jgi:ribulose bisphosphate carboxylase small subunit
MTFYIAPRFLNKLAVHITKNFLDLPKMKVPLILGVHGRKGEGKTFQCELVFQEMGIEVVHISAGELESPDAGDPSRLIRLRYREAAELIRTRGKMAVLMINDLDAGAGRVDQGTQYTVNTQLVNATLMNIADNPTNVQLPGSYDEKPLPRVPIIVTGNDFATLYAPLVRDGRMEKFYWEPSRDDKIGIVGGIFSEDGLSQSDIMKLVDTFSEQSVDFYGALRSRIYDEQIEDFIYSVGVKNVSFRVVNSKQPPEFKKPNFSVGHLIEQGQLLVREQGRLQELRLAREYNQALRTDQPGSPQHPTVFSHRTAMTNGHEDAAPSGSPSPDATPQPEASSATPRSAFHGNASRHSQSNGSHVVSNGSHAEIDPEVMNQVRHLVSQGYRIGVEHVDRRRFRTGSWKSCGSIQAPNESEAIATLESCLTEHDGEYVRIFGIDSARRRVMETIVQRP